jgi:hypothetical protein
MSFSPILIYDEGCDVYFVGNHSDTTSCGVRRDVTHLLDHVDEAKKRGIEMLNVKSETGKQYSRDRITFQNRLVAACAWGSRT